MTNLRQHIKKQRHHFLDKAMVFLVVSYGHRLLCSSNSKVGKFLWRREWQSTPVFLPGEFHGQKSLAGYSPWGGKESDTTERLTYIHNIHIHSFPLPIFPIELYEFFIYFTCVCYPLSRVRLFVTPRTVAHQASLSMEYSRQEYWSGLPFPSPEELPNPGIELWSPAWQADSLLFELQGPLLDT